MKINATFKMIMNRFDTGTGLLSLKNLLTLMSHNKFPKDNISDDHF